MPYDESIKYSATASVLIHLTILLIVGYRMASQPIGIVPERSPIVLNLTPRIEPKAPDEAEEEERQRKLLRLVDPGAAAEAPSEDAELISSQNSKAQSAKASEGDPDTPAVERISDFEEMGRRPTPAQPLPQQMAAVPPLEAVEPEPEPAPKPEAAAEPAPETPPGEEPKRLAAVSRAEAPTPREPEPPEAKPREPEPEEPKQPAEEAVQMAQAQPLPPSPPVQDLRATRGREQGGADPGGFTSFEANQHELGAYMLEIRTHVEREWRLALATRYPGSGRARMVLDCSIRPDGTLEYVRIVDGGDSPGFATLCKASVERAARSFKPFPFEVPDIYRSKNLEVRWQFTYM